MTLQETQNFLTNLARETGAELQATIRLGASGATLSIFWEGDGDAVPLEANLFFGSTEEEDDIFLFSIVIDYRRFVWALEEGLNDEQIQNHSSLIVESIEDLKNYLQGKPYVYAKPL